MCVGEPQVQRSTRTSAAPDTSGWCRPHPVRRGLAFPHESGQRVGRSRVTSTASRPRRAPALPRRREGRRGSPPQSRRRVRGRLGVVLSPGPADLLVARRSPRRSGGYHWGLWSAEDRLDPASADRLARVVALGATRSRPRRVRRWPRRPGGRASFSVVWLRGQACSPHGSKQPPDFGRIRVAQDRSASGAAALMPSVR